MKKQTTIIGYIIVIGLTILFTHLFKNCSDKDDDIVSEIPLYPPDGDPEEVIELCKAQRLFKNYERRADSIEAYETGINEAFRASRTITFEYQELVNYFNFIEQITEKAGQRISGIRFFLGKYPYDHPKYPGQQMLFFNPTIKNATNNKEIIYAIRESDDQAEIVLINNLEEFELDCDVEGKTSAHSKAGLLSFSSSIVDDDLISLQGQGGQISPPDND
ncbi:hypothetical protein [Aquimarina sp. RZ0]|uniref:hypothetical protein n=1 Tax=Aquimarina sp. RZ0 TaxID=2607730 RepID=UPI0011F13E8E|nr:hypothetical protein [Aquimarina sp. RZ0]KAA1247451.1 hypothetical protein F0000_03050 [Aquimarina sp. RZ0]